MENGKKKKLNTNSNSYTIIYSVIIVVVVAFLLALVFQAFKPMQEANIALDKKKQILYSLNIGELNDEAANNKYKDIIIADNVIDKAGKILQKGSKGGENAGFKQNSADFKAGRLALYVCKVDGETKYVIPVYGMGLWGGISGYIAINADKETVYGAYFTHESETAGLGAEIKDSKEWQNQFRGKKLLNKEHSAIALSVLKKVEDPSTQVDAVTGATLTCNGVTNMLHSCLAAYMNFLTAK